MATTGDPPAGKPSSPWAAARDRLLKAAAKPFKLRPFKAPWWARNNHLQTILGTFLPVPPSLTYHRERVRTTCGDFFDVDILYPPKRPSHIPSLPQAAQSTQGGQPAPAGTKQRNPVVVVVHGLEGSSKSPHSVRIAAAVSDLLGWTVYLKNFRGCSGTANHGLRAYHVGFTEDLDLVVRRLAAGGTAGGGVGATNGNIGAAAAATHIYLAGFSLGGNVIAKFLSEIGEKAVSDEYRIAGAAISCVPFKPAVCQPSMDSGINKRLYAANFLRDLKKKAAVQAKAHPGAFDLNRVMKADTIGEFDDAFIAPVFGFEGKGDYYRKCDVTERLKEVAVPVLAFNASDDPFLPISVMPTKEEVGNRMVQTHRVEGGGHCGFVDSFTGHGYMGTEMARFFKQIEDSLDEE